MSNDLKVIAERAQRYHSDLVAFRPLALADAWPLFDATRTPAFNEKLLWAQPNSPSQVFRRVERILEEIKLGKMGALSVVNPQSGEWIGVVRFFPTLLGDGSTGMEIGVWVHPRFWSSGATFSLVVAATDFLLRESSYAKTISRMSSDNTKVRRLCQKLGYQLESEQVVYREDGTPMPIEIWTIRLDQWKAPRKSPEILTEILTAVAA